MTLRHRELTVENVADSLVSAFAARSYLEVQIYVVMKDPIPGRR